MSVGQVPPRPARSESQLSFWLSLGVIVLAALAGAVLFATHAVAGWVACIGAVLIGGGVIIPYRGLLGFGTLLLATGSIVATAGQTTVNSLAVNAGFAIICIAVLVGADLAYVARRSTVISSITVEGFVGAHVAAALAGVFLSVLLLAVVLAIVWPGWLLIVPAAALLVGSLALVQSANRYQRGVNLVPQAAAPTGAALPDPRVRASGRSVPPPPQPADRVRSPSPSNAPWPPRLPPPPAPTQLPPRAYPPPPPHVPPPPHWVKDR